MFRQEQNARPVDQRTGHHQALLHAFGIALHPVLAARIQSNAPQQSVRVKLLDVEQLGEQPQVLDGSHLLVQVGDFKAHPDLRLHRFWCTRDVQSEQGGLSLLRAQLPGQHSDRGRLARAIRAEKPQNLACGDLEANMIYRGQWAVAVG
jgi:hypothetical protein